MDKVTVILDAPMWIEGKLQPAGTELVFSKKDYEANKTHFAHHLKEGTNAGITGNK